MHIIVTKDSSLYLKTNLLNNLLDYFSKNVKIENSFEILPQQ